MKKCSEVKAEIGQPELECCVSCHGEDGCMHHSQDEETVVCCRVQAAYLKWLDGVSVPAGKTSETVA